MPSLRHQFLAAAIPRLRSSGPLRDEAAEREKLAARHAQAQGGLPTSAVPLFERRYRVSSRIIGTGTPFEVLDVAPRARASRTSATLYYVHGGGFVGGIDAFHPPAALRMAAPLHARTVLPDYPLAPEHTWADSHQALVDDIAAHLATGERLVLAGDSAGGGLALALALSLRDRGGPQPSRLVLISPWVDPSESTPQTAAMADVDPWLSLSKMRAYARWWAGSTADLSRPEVSPALGDLSGLPPTLMFCGTRDLLVPGCRMLAARAAGTNWQLTYREAPGLIHVFPLLPGIPEAARARREVREFLCR